MEFVKWLAQMVGHVWHILDIDLLGIGLNLNMLILGISVFGMFISFFKRIGGMESDGMSSVSSFMKKEK